MVIKIKVHELSIFNKFAIDLSQSKSGNSSDRTPLHWAASDGKKDLVFQLVRDGADIDATDEVSLRYIL